MNLLKSFSLTTGLTPNKSYIYENFYPLDFEKYIILDTQSKDSNFHYAFWFRVIELIEPFLKKQDIKIVHFVEDRRYHYDHIYLDSSVKVSQKAYLLKKALMFCGTSKLYSIMASEFNIKQCFIKCDYDIDNTLVKENEVINTDNKRNNFLNPTLFQVNNVRPEEIARKILFTLFSENVSFDNTLSVGKIYAGQTIEVIPDCTFKIGNNSKNEIVIRMDFLFSEENLNTQLSLEPASIVTNKRINLNILSDKKNQIKKFYYKIEKNSDPTFLDDLDILKIDYDLITNLTGEDLDKEKIKYLNYKRINRLALLNLDFLEGLDKSKIYFKTNKIIIKNGKTYPSRWHAKMDLNSKNVRSSDFAIPDKIDDSFKEEADYFYFLTKEQL